MAEGNKQLAQVKPDGDTGSITLVAEPRVKKKLPSLYKVLLLNDDYTPMEFVVEVLERFFQKTSQEATEIMLSVHNRGKGICGIYPRDIAETKATVVSDYAKRHQYPLQCTVEKA